MKSYIIELEIQVDDSATPETCQRDADITVNSVNANEQIVRVYEYKLGSGSTYMDGI